jgi:hypothetical protein
MKILPPLNISLLKKGAAKDLAYVQRHIIGLTSYDRVELRRLKEIFTVLLVIRRRRRKSAASISRLNKVIKIVAAKYIDLQFVSQEAYEKERCINPDRHRTLDSFSGPDFKAFFRYEKADLEKMMNLLRFPEKVILGNRQTATGETVFLRGLYELVSGERQYGIIRNVFGGSQPYQSLCFKYFITHMYDNFKHLVNDNLRWWYENNYLEESRAAIQRKINLPDNQYAMFIDCNCLTCRVTGGGPAESGTNSVRWDKTIQQAFFNGWKSVHGLKHQTVDIAHGFTIDLFGPTSLRRNDLDLLRESNIHDRIANLQRGCIYQLKMFGDSAYKVRSHMRSYFSVKDLRASNLYREEEVQAFKAWNYKMKTVRISIEWSYGVTGKLFRYLTNVDKLKLMQSEHVSKVYTVATLFRNFHVALYGGQNANYFNIPRQPASFLECYINQTPLL